MIKYKTYIKALLFVIMIISLFGFANYRNSMRKIVKAEIVFENGKGKFITKVEVKDLLIENLGNIKNKNKNKAVLHELEANIENNGMVEKAEVFITIDGVLKAKIYEKKPIARIVVNNTSYYLDTKGNKMNLSKSHSARVPFVTGVLGKDDLEKVYHFIMEVLHDEFMKKQVISIHIKENTLFELKTRMGNQIIEFGELKNISNKIKKLKAFYQKMEKDKSLNKYRRINIVYSKQVVCTK